jgi:hypothetical protein
MAILTRGVGSCRLRCTLTTLRVLLVALAAMSAAVLAHVTIDIVGDYVLARDAYDGITHSSRVVLVVGLAVLLLAAGSRLLFDLLDRRCVSRASLLQLVRDSLGGPLPFIAQSVAVCVVALAAMELFDCYAAHAAPVSLVALFGGSYLLGLGAACVTGVLTGWLTHRVVTIISEREPEIVALLWCLRALALCGSAGVQLAERLRTPHSIARALLLSARGSKRGPPLPIPA